MSTTREAPLAHDVFRQEAHPLDPFFRPRAVAVVGATEARGSVGRTLLWNLLSTPDADVTFEQPIDPLLSHAPQTPCSSLA
jgi:acetyltransferase